MWVSCSEDWFELSAQKGFLFNRIIFWISLCNNSTKLRILWYFPTPILISYCNQHVPTNLFLNHNYFKLAYEIFIDVMLSVVLRKTYASNKLVYFLMHNRIGSINSKTRKQYYRMRTKLRKVCNKNSHRTQSHSFENGNSKYSHASNRLCFHGFKSL